MNGMRLPLPEELEGRAFAVGEAKALGIGPGRLVSPDLSRPFRGVRIPADAALEELRDRAIAFSPRLRPHQAFGGLSAAALHGLPLAARHRGDPGVDLIVEHGRNLPRGRNVRARRVAPERWSIAEVDGIRTASPLLTLETLVARSGAEELGVIADALLTASRRYPGLSAPGRALATAGELGAFADAWGRRPGAEKLRQAVAFAREGVDSPMESRLRWAIVMVGGFPEPLVGAPAYEGDLLLGTPDLSYPELRIAIEYEGDQHRVDKRRWREDVARKRLFEAWDWIVLRAIADDIHHGAQRFLADLAHARSTRGG